MRSIQVSPPIRLRKYRDFILPTRRQATKVIEHITIHLNELEKLTNTKFPVIMPEKPEQYDKR